MIIMIMIARMVISMITLIMLLSLFDDDADADGGDNDAADFGDEN